MTIQEEVQRDSNGRSKKNRQDEYIRGRDKIILRARRHRLKKVYGITPEQFDLLWEYGKGCCYICGWTLERRQGGHAIDHNHQTGETRGLLCYPCNVLLGRFEKHREIVLDYLDNPPSRQVIR